MNSAEVPMQSIGPVQIKGPHINDQVMVPLATYESPLWPSTNRGAKVSRLSDGINVVVLDDRMTRSVFFEVPNATIAQSFVADIENRLAEMQTVVARSSRFAKLLNINTQVVGTLVFIRFEIHSGDASGHNMVTKAAEQLMDWLLTEYDFLEYGSISGNFCTDKKATAVNGILGRGKYTIAEVIVPRQVCIDVLKTTPEKIVNLNIKKNLIGTMLAGGLRSANAHYANMLLAFYLATGQDAANIVEGSQGITFCELRGQDLYFSVTLPNVILGTVGNGKDLDFVEENLTLMGCTEKRAAGENAKRLASILAATVLCGELSLMAAQTNPGELMRSHVRFERQKADLATRET